MTIWGKVFGGMAGFAFGGPLGALVGAFAGHAMDQLREQSEASGQSPSRAAKQTVFAVAAIVLGAKMAKADGRVSRAEVNAFKQVFQIPPTEKTRVGRIFNLAKRDAGGFEPYARQVEMLFRDQPVVLEELVAGLFHIARADGEPGPAQLSFLRKIAGIFGMSDVAFDRLKAGSSPQSISGDPYAVLGVKRDARDEEVKAAYRRLIRENHPDALVAKGMPQEFIQLANERMAAINAAYDQIEKLRGLR